MNSYKLNDVEIELSKKLHELTETYIADIVKTLNPNDFIDKEPLFCTMILVCPSVAAVTLINSLSNTFGLDRQDIFDGFIDQLIGTFEFIDNKDE